MVAGGYLPLDGQRRRTTAVLPAVFTHDAARAARAARAAASLSPFQAQWWRGWCGKHEIRGWI